MTETISDLSYKIQQVSPGITHISCNQNQGRNMNVTRCGHSADIAQTCPEVRQVAFFSGRQWHLCHAPCLHPGHLNTRGNTETMTGQTVAKDLPGASLCSRRLDAGGVEDADDRVPGPHPPAACIPIGAGQALCVQETFLPALNLERNK